MVKSFWNLCEKYITRRSFGPLNLGYEWAILFRLITGRRTSLPEGLKRREEKRIGAVHWRESFAPLLHLWIGETWGLKIRILFFLSLCFFFFFVPLKQECIEAPERTPHGITAHSHERTSTRFLYRRSKRSSNVFTIMAKLVQNTM